MTDNGKGAKAEGFGAFIDHIMSVTLFSMLRSMCHYRDENASGLRAMVLAVVHCLPRGRPFLAITLQG